MVKALTVEIENVSEIHVQCSVQTILSYNSRPSARLKNIEGKTAAKCRVGTKHHFTSSLFLSNISRGWLARRSSRGNLNMNAPFFNNFPLFFIRTEDAIIGLNENFRIVCLRIVRAELLHATPADQHLFFNELGDCTSISFL